MKVLVVGANGHLGQRIVHLALAASHTVVAFVRSSSTFLSNLSHSDVANPNLSVIEGDALSVSDLAGAMDGCEGVINCAGFAALFPWQHSSFPDIGKAVVDAACQALVGRRRVWLIAGMFVCDRPGGGLLMDSNHLFHESRITWEHLKKRGKGLCWTMMCPAIMRDREATDVEEGLDLPPRWPVPAWLCRVPVISFFTTTLAAALFYTVSFESVARYVVDHLEEVGRLRGKRVALRVKKG